MVKNVDDSMERAMIDFIMIAFIPDSLVVPTKSEASKIIRRSLPLCLTRCLMGSLCCIVFEDKTCLISIPMSVIETTSTFHRVIISTSTFRHHPSFLASRIQVFTCRNARPNQYIPALDRQVFVPGVGIILYAVLLLPGKRLSRMFCQIPATSYNR